MTTEARAAADLASELPMDHPLARAARSVLQSCVRLSESEAMSDTTKIGTPLRDAAVDPHPGDFMAPINAGEADPHGPLVYSLQPGTPEYDAAFIAERARLEEAETNG